MAERTPGADYYYYVQDVNDSVVALTNSTDVVANTYAYDSFGTVTSSTGSAANSFGFDGGYTGPQTGLTNAQGGLILFGARYYDPATATWTQPDPGAQGLATDPTQADPYAFAGDDPINNVDPTGDITEKQKKAVSNVLKLIKVGAKAVQQILKSPAAKEIAGMVSDGADTLDSFLDYVPLTDGSVKKELPSGGDDRCGQLQQPADTTSEPVDCSLSPFDPFLGDA